MNSDRLEQAECEYLRRLAADKLFDLRKENDILGEQVFDILAQYCRVLYYPLEDDDVWGFFEKVNGERFVCINTSIDIDKQVFVAAHELYHIWYDDGKKLILAEDLEERTIDVPIDELKANRFAAEFLVPESLLKREIDLKKINEKTIKVPDIVRLARVFLVPYRTMVKRLYEIRVIDEDKRNRLLTVLETEVAILRRRLGLDLIERSKKISLANLIDNALSAYEKQLITRERLEYLLSLAKAAPEEVGVSAEERYIPPSDEELDSLMEDC